MVNSTLEDEATLFACLLLMPLEFIKEDVEKGIDLGDDRQIKALAKKYDVSIAALSFRISHFLKYEQ